MIEEEQSVLVIDDEKINLKVISNMLRDEVKVLVAKSGEQGIRKAIKYQPDLILLDVLMPVMDGFETMEQLRRDVRTCAIPVIFITALNDASHEEKGLLLGASDYIQKPLYTKIVQARIRLHLQLVKQRIMLERLAHIDPLTSLANRRKYQHVLFDEWRFAVENKSLISLLVIDIDNFKQYNDCYGHAAGDKVLQRVAEVLSRQAKDSRSLVARYGGEEFVIILFGHSHDQAQTIAQACMREVEALNLPYLHEGHERKVTISVGGVTSQPTQTCQCDDMFNDADQMLYLAKHNGKNKVQWSPSGALQIQGAL